jgi:hypothetical protein
MTLSITTLLSAKMLSVAFNFCYAECRYDECRYPECRTPLKFPI